MGDLFTITNDIRNIAKSAIDSMINQLGKPCRIVYPPMWQPCVNCHNIGMIGGKPVSRYKHGGPLPFPNGTICPMCNSTGKYRANAATETVTLLCSWNPDNWVKNDLGLRIPGGTLGTKGYIWDMPKIRNADYIEIQVVEGYAHWRFQLSGEPIDQGNIVQGRYFVALWERMQG